MLSAHKSAINSLRNTLRTNTNVNHNVSRTRKLKNFPLMNVASVFKKTKKQNEMFLEAVKVGNLVQVDALINQGVDPTLNQNTAIWVASAKGHLNVVNRLLEDNRVNPAANDNSAIRMAATYGHLDIVNRLLELRNVDGNPIVNPSAVKNYAIRWASGNGHLAIVDRLLQDPRVNPSANNFEALRWASMGGHDAIVARLRADPRVGDVVVGGHRRRKSRDQHKRLRTSRILRQTNKCKDKTRKYCNTKWKHSNQ